MAANPKDTQPIAPPAGLAGAKPRVLVAEDEVGLLRVIDRALSSVGFDVTAVTDGRAALAALASGAYDVVLSDIAMPHFDGIQVLRTVRAHDPDVPVLLMTGAPDVESAVQAVAYGALQYITKPIALRKLEEHVAHAAQLHQLARIKREALSLLGDTARGAADRAGLEVSFERALGRLWMAYQPIVHAPTRALYGYEALLRSGEPTLPHPGAVLDAAERLGRLPSLGRAVRAHVAEPPLPLPEGAFVFVNLHPEDLADEALLAPDAPLAKMASRVVLEITERATLDTVRDLRGRVTQLREAGYRIAIDDLGAGYAGLTSFAALEPEIVKLDMALVRGVDLSVTRQKLVRSLATLCHDMGILVVAEGVETVEERDALVELGCDLLQGYLIARPDRAYPGFAWE